MHNPRMMLREEAFTTGAALYANCALNGLEKKRPGKEEIAMRQEKMKRGFKLPHVYIILMFMMLLVVILSWIIPSGVYERVLDSNTGREIIKSG